MEQIVRGIGTISLYPSKPPETLDMLEKHRR